MEQDKPKRRALMLFSGGLDSMLAAKMLQEQGIDVTLLCFESYFFNSDSAKKAAKELNLPLRLVDISNEQLEIVKHPKYGYGSAINPCIDCHLLMLENAKLIMDKEGFDFVATGEVLGERSMSQNKQSLDLIENKSGLAGNLLRPLSAKLLPKTTAEINGLVNREKLIAISGRSRKPQLDLAARFKISYIPQPAGGCILADENYGGKLAKLLKIKPDADGSDAKVLRFGRVFWRDNVLIIVARDKNECEVLKTLAKKDDLLFVPDNFMGATVLARDFSGNFDFEKLKAAGREYVLRFSKKAPKDAEITAEEITSKQ